MQPDGHVPPRSRHLHASTMPVGHPALLSIAGASTSLDDPTCAIRHSPGRGRVRRGASTRLSKQLVTLLRNCCLTHEVATRCGRLRPHGVDGVRHRPRIVQRVRHLRCGRRAHAWSDRSRAAGWPRPLDGQHGLSAADHPSGSGSANIAPRHVCTSPRLTATRRKRCRRSLARCGLIPTASSRPSGPRCCRCFSECIATPRSGHLNSSGVQQTECR